MNDYHQGSYLGRTETLYTTGSQWSWPDNASGIFNFASGGTMVPISGTIGSHTEYGEPSSFK